MDTAEFVEKLKLLGACDAALEWVATQPDAATAWETCPYHWWMTWLVSKLHVRGCVKSHTMALVAAHCASKAASGIQEHEGCVHETLETVKKWVLNGVGLCEVRKARDEAIRVSLLSPQLSLFNRAHRAAAEAAGVAIRTDASYAMRRSLIWIENDCCVEDLIRDIVRWHNVEAWLDEYEGR